MVHKTVSKLIKKLLTTSKKALIMQNYQKVNETTKA